MDKRKKSVGARARPEQHYCQLRCDSVNSTFKLVSESRRQAGNAQQSWNKNTETESNGGDIANADRSWKYPRRAHQHQYILNNYRFTPHPYPTTAFLADARNKSEKVKHKLEDEPSTSGEKDDQMKILSFVLGNKSSSQSLATMTGRRLRRTINQSMGLQKSKKSSNMPAIRKPTSNRKQTNVQINAIKPPSTVSQQQQKVEALNSKPVMMEELRQSIIVPGTTEDTTSVILDAIRVQDHDVEYNKSSAKFHRCNKEWCKVLKECATTYKCPLIAFFSAIIIIIIVSVLLIFFPIFKAFESY